MCKLVLILWFRAVTNNTNHYQLICQLFFSINRFIVWSIKCERIVKKCHSQFFSEPTAMFSICLFCPTDSPEPKGIWLFCYYVEEKLQIFTFQKLEAEKVWHFSPESFHEEGFVSHVGILSGFVEFIKKVSVCVYTLSCKHISFLNTTITNLLINYHQDAQDLHSFRNIIILIHSEKKKNGKTNWQKWKNYENISSVTAEEFNTLLLRTFDTLQSWESKCIWIKSKTHRREVSHQNTDTQRLCFFADCAYL